MHTVHKYPVAVLHYSKLYLNYSRQLSTIQNVRHIRGVSTVKVTSDALTVSMLW